MFLLIMVSVPITDRGLVTALASSTAIGDLAFLGFGRSQGPDIQSQYVFVSTNPMAAIRRRLSNDDRVKIFDSSQSGSKKYFIFYLTYERN
jgi:hypothetical protein